MVNASMIKLSNNYKTQSSKIKIGILTQFSMTLQWIKNQDWLSRVETSSQLIKTYCVVVTIALVMTIICRCINSTICKLEVSIQCFLLFFGIAKNSNNTFMDSYSSIGQPYCNRWKTMVNCNTFLAFSPTITFTTYLVII